MKKSIPLKEIVGFLPYELKMIFQSAGGRIITVNGLKNLPNGVAVLNDYYAIYLNSSGFKPIVRPLSDLTKEITYNGETFVPIWKIFGTSFQLQNYEPCITRFNGYFKLSITNGSMVFDANLNQYEMLFELKFDIFDWIKDGLAVSINDL